MFSLCWANFGGYGLHVRNKKRTVNSLLGLIVYV